MLPDTLQYPPFPPLQWDQFFWSGELVLPAWAGFEIKTDEDRGTKRRRSSARPVRLSIVPLEATARSHPTAEQVAAFRHLIDNEPAVGETVANDLVDYCPGEAYDGDDDDLMELSEPDELRLLVELSSVHVLRIFHDGMACIGFEFRCVWDEEHGAGVMTHRGKVIATGQADCSFMEWVAEQGLAKKYGRARE